MKEKKTPPVAADSPTPLSRSLARVSGSDGCLGFARQFFGFTVLQFFSVFQCLSVSFRCFFSVFSGFFNFFSIFLSAIDNWKSDCGKKHVKQSSLPPEIL